MTMLYNTFSKNDKVVSEYIFQNKFSKNEKVISEKISKNDKVIWE